MVILWIICGLLFLVLSCLLLLSISGWMLRLYRTADQIHFVKTSDGVRLAVHRYRPKNQKYKEPLLLCHGFGVNRYFFDLESDRSLVWMLADAGFDVWSLELRGHGLSRIPQRPEFVHSFDDHAQKDLPAAIELVCRESQQPKLMMLGHSMGGLLGYTYAQADNQRMQALVTLCSPVRFDLSVGFRRLRLMAQMSTLGQVVWLRPLARLSAPLCGKLPTCFLRTFALPGSIEPRLMRRILAKMVENTSARLVRQMLVWERQGDLRTFDGQQDYKEKLDQIKIPVLIITSEKDLLAPPDAVKPAYEAISNGEKQLRIFGRDAGDDHDFGHGDIIAGPHAAQIVFPEILEWLERYATKWHESA